MSFELVILVKVLSAKQFFEVQKEMEGPSWRCYIVNIYFLISHLIKTKLVYINSCIVRLFPDNTTGLFF